MRSRTQAPTSNVALFVLSEIEVARDVDGAVTVTGGKGTVLHLWKIDMDHLTPIGFKYRLP